MAKWFGNIGFIYQEELEDDPGVFQEHTEVRPYYGDILRNTKRYSDQTESTNVTLNINNKISIVADQFAIDHFSSMRYLEWYNELWNIGEVEVNYPRLIISIGGVYNGRDEAQGTSENS